MAPSPRRRRPRRRPRARGGRRRPRPARAARRRGRAPRSGPGAVAQPPEQRAGVARPGVRRSNARSRPGAVAPATPPPRGGAREPSPRSRRSASRRPGRPSRARRPRGPRGGASAPRRGARRRLREVRKRCCGAERRGRRRRRRVARRAGRPRHGVVGRRRRRDRERRARAGPRGRARRARRRRRGAAARARARARRRRVVQDRLVASAPPPLLAPAHAVVGSSSGRVAQRVPLGGAHQLGRRVVERRGAVEGLGVERLARDSRPWSLSPSSTTASSSCPCRRPCCRSWVAAPAPAVTWSGALGTAGKTEKGKSTSSADNSSRRTIDEV